MSLPGISIWQYCQKTYAKSKGGGWVFGKNIKRGDGHTGEVVYRRWGTRMHIMFSN